MSFSKQKLIAAINTIVARGDEHAHFPFRQPFRAKHCLFVCFWSVSSHFSLLQVIPFLASIVNVESSPTFYIHPRIRKLNEVVECF